MRRLLLGAVGAAAMAASSASLNGRTRTSVNFAASADEIARLAPVSGSGVRLGANTLPGMWLSAQGTSQPAPVSPGSAGAPWVFQSRSEWQWRQWASPSTM